MEEFQVKQGLDNKLPSNKNINTLYFTTDTKRLFIGDSELQNRVIANYVISTKSGDELNVNNTDNVETAFGKVEKSIADINSTLGDVNTILDNILGV